MHTSQTIGRKIGGPGVLTAQDVRVRRNLRDLSFIYAAVLTSFAIIVIAFAFLWSRIMVVKIGYEISKADSVKASLAEQNKRLRIEFMRLKSPDRIEKIASNELGLVRPTSEQIVNIR